MDKKAMLYNMAAAVMLKEANDWNLINHIVKNYGAGDHFGGNQSPLNHAIRQFQGWSGQRTSGSDHPQILQNVSHWGSQILNHARSMMGKQGSADPYEAQKYRMSEFKPPPVVKDKTRDKQKIRTSQHADKLQKKAEGYGAWSEPTEEDQNKLRRNRLLAQVKPEDVYGQMRDSNRLEAGMSAFGNDFLRQTSSQLGVPVPPYAADEGWEPKDGLEGKMHYQKFFNDLYKRNLKAPVQEGFNASPGVIGASRLGRAAWDVRNSADPDDLQQLDNALDSKDQEWTQDRWGHRRDPEKKWSHGALKLPNSD